MTKHHKLVEKVTKKSETSVKRHKTGNFGEKMLLHSVKKKSQASVKKTQK